VRTLSVAGTAAVTVLVTAGLTRLRAAKARSAPS
jgi:hypothetical protein